MKTINNTKRYADMSLRFEEDIKRSERRVKALSGLLNIAGALVFAALGAYTLLGFGGLL